jgi:ParB-like chromosome segregation protein Spo0J
MHVEPHKFALLFPEASQEDFNGLVEDIKANGLVEPIMLFEGKILDGRNRLRACTEAGTPPTFMPFTGDTDEAFHYVISKNLHRRHLTNVQRAFIVAKLKDDPRARNAQERAKIANVPKQTQQHVEKVMNHLPEFTEAMVQGTVSPNMLLPLQKNPERRKTAKAMLDSGQIQQLLTMLSGKEHRAFTSYRDEVLSIKRVQAVPSIDKVIKLIDVSLGFLHRFHQIKQVLEELVKAEITQRQQELLKMPLEAIKSVIPAQKQELHTLATQLTPETAKVKLGDFYVGVLDEMKDQVKKHLSKRKMKIKPPIVVESNAAGLAASGNNKARPDRCQAQAYALGYDLSDLSTGADVEVVVVRLFEQYDEIMQSIVNAVEMLTSVPNNHVEAAFAAKNIPDDIHSAVVVVPVEKPKLITTDENSRGRALNFDNVKKFVEKQRSNG